MELPELQIMYSYLSELILPAGCISPASFIKIYFITIALYSRKNKGGLQNPVKRFWKFSKRSKCVKSLKKRIKISAELFEGSAFYPTPSTIADRTIFPVLDSKKGFREKIRNLQGSVQNH